MVHFIAGTLALGCVTAGFFIGIFLIIESIRKQYRNK
jgi:hypothetical protein